MKTDILFYAIFQRFPRFFFELIGRPETDPSLYQFNAPELKQRAFRLDGLFLPLENLPELPIYFIEVQFQKKTAFYSRLFASIFLYFYQYNPPNQDWYAIVIYRRRSIEVPPPRRYRELMENRVLRFYLDEIEDADEESLGLGILKLVVESKRTTGNLARSLIVQAQEDLTDGRIQQQVIELIETIVLYKFPTLSREEIETMLGLNELKQTRVYQEAREEGKVEGIEQGKLEGKVEAKLEMVPLLIELGLSIEEIAQRLGLDVEMIRQAAAEDS